ncbi:MAG TPA: class II fructose-bisphosphate aldolase [Gemmatimonadaceae bacterium]|nr:class II fructose-bisphosphate aldolase [Gemmatimonadaceae bacterium]
MSNNATRAVQTLGGAVRVDNGHVVVAREKDLASPAMDALVREAVFGQGQARDHARWLIWEIGQEVGVRAASINDLYLARGRGEARGGWTVPAMNVRGMSYDTARAIFRTAIRHEVGAFILEIARSEIAYTDQRPSEYVAVMLAAALREGFRGPVFIQGDHFQVNAKKFAVDPSGEVAAVKQLAMEAITAGFYNIDVDTSTLVDISKATLDEQQRLNYEQAVEITSYIREIEPDDVTISVGGEIGEVGGHNSNVHELRAFMEGYNRTLRERLGRKAVGLSKISVQTGTSHGGVVLPDGKIAEVKLDLEALEELSRVAQKEYGMAGAVQHGASTLPDDAFNAFPRVGACEIHLATNFQNLLYDQLPPDMREKIYRWLDQNAADERKPKDSPDQFYYKTRKKALGPFKRELWDLPQVVRETLARVYDEKFAFLFQKLGVVGTAELVEKWVSPAEQHRRAPDALTPAVVAAPDDPDAGE